MSRLTRWSLNGAYAAALTLASPAVAWAAWRDGKYREGHAAKLLGRVPERTSQRRCVWLHAVSVGEVNLLGVLIDEFRGRHPDWDVVVSTTTKTGYDLARKKYGGEHTVFYAPLDFSWAVDEAMRRIRPDLLLLAELELWPNLIDSAKRHGARVGIVNGRLSENSFKGYRRVGSLVRKTLEKIDLVAAQDEATADRFRTLGAPRVAVSGSLKYDGASTDRRNPRTAALRELAGFDGSETAWLAGSTQAPEESVCLRVFESIREDHPDLRLVLVPRHPERFEEVAQLLKESGLPFALRSQLNRNSQPAERPHAEQPHAQQPHAQQPHSGQPKGGQPRPSLVGVTDQAQAQAQDLNGPQPESPAVLLVDTVGELGAWWGTAQLGFVGGSFGDRGGQNMIEPAAYGVATCYGPNTRNFRDIVAALEGADAAHTVQDEDDLEAFLRGCLELPEEARALGDRARAFVATQLGATGRTVDLLDEIIPAEATPSKAAA
ncbi:3-deoxy-D-manno-octulosonic acid transferase [Planctomycetes bacterium MalM25]|nr:3-deoxy-D-manno-octulosonic acid transferase [Planctomycetes bacterium MalM25]